MRDAFIAAGQMGEDAAPGRIGQRGKCAIQNRWRIFNHLVNYLTKRLSNANKKYLEREIASPLVVFPERVSTFMANPRMFDTMDYVIRPLTPADEPILWEMLYQALQTAEGETVPSRDIVRQPEFARYVEGWGRTGDAGFVAHDTEMGELLGAVWFRPPAGDETPELAFAVKPGYRKHGIGAALLTQWVKANPEQSEISLRVPASNPAVRLYERFGFKVIRQGEGTVTMRRET